ncbi:monovalent cation:proton antiporter-2 (CPA2) family protein [Azospirillum agricola]|uniref:monovalent cation:proton antiporter-2 (CPA2) family protein n=1 Tax=Azospirillum agricola TaxID=1720247 RepID=UPI000A0F2334|nr:monovalent cation:proton antiporter-2 (CPA2) family protein [Azospirillum agricola]SMH44488.1 Kef-type potassium/proton antiporter, CPA2 family [Azospirillum lipoferum]
MHDTTILLDILLLLLSAIVVVPLFQALRIPAVLGYLVAGVMLGPHAPGPAVDLKLPQLLSEFGIVFLLFAIGLELPLSRLQAMRRYIFGLGLMQVLATSTMLGLAAYALGLPPEAALVVGGMLAFSSTATVLKLLVERGETVARFGRISVAVLIFQDLAVVPLLTLLPLLADPNASIPLALALAALKAGAAILFIMLLGRFVVRPVYRFIASAGNPELFTATNLFVVLAVGWLTAEAGMSMALGAFLAGMLLADTAYRHQVEADIEPFRGLLLGLFFMTVGMALDLPAMEHEAGTIAGLTVALLFGKSLLLFLLCRLSGLGVATSLRIGLLLSQGGEFAFVLIGKATALSVLDTRTGLLVSSSVALSMAVTPAIGAIAQRLAQAIEARRGAEAFGIETSDLKSHVLIAGYGRVGKAVARLLTAHGIPYVALDLEPQRIATARGEGLPVYYGDASHASVLRAAGVERARAAVITLNRPDQAQRAVEAIHASAAGLPIIARAHDIGQIPALANAGASAVVPETMEASLQLAGMALRSAGIEASAVDSSLREFREGNYGALAERRATEAD